MNRKTAIATVLIVLVVAGVSLTRLIGGRAAPEPEEAPPERVQHRIEVPVGGITIDPPPEEMDPVVTGERALELAREELSGARDAKKITPMFGLFTERLPDRISYDRLPAWIVRVEGLCVEAHGPAVTIVDGKPRVADYGIRCLGYEWNVVIDAMTGEFLLDFSYQ